MNLLAGGEILGKGVYPVKTTVMEGDLPIDRNASGTYFQPCFCFKNYFLYKINTFTFTDITVASNLTTCLILLGSPCVPRAKDLKS